jgi:hypothetical protein
MDTVCRVHLSGSGFEHNISNEGAEGKGNYSNVQIAFRQVVVKVDMWTECGGKGVLEGVRRV